MSARFLAQHRSSFVAHSGGGRVINRFIVGAMLSTLSLSMTLLIGCGATDRPADGPIALPDTISGVMHGGQQPVTGATIQLYQASTSGYSSAATPLGSSVTTDANGNFTFNNLSNSPESFCSSGSSLVYVAASGGISTSQGSSYSNPQLSMMAVLGACSGLSSSTSIIINEVTTVAAVAALGPFMSGYANVGTSSTNVAGLTQAFTTAAGLASTTSGMAPGKFTGTFPSAEVVTVPSAEIYALANSLSVCVNISGVTTGAAAAAGDGTNCGKLLTDATPPGGTAPTDVVGAALDILQNPTNNVAAIYNLGPPAAAFGNALASAPADWSMIVTFGATSGVSGWVNSPWQVALDASGNVWFPNYNGSAYLGETTSTGAWLSTTAGTSNLTHFTTTGGSSPVTISPVEAQYTGVALDLSGNAWVTMYGGEAVLEMSPSRAYLRQFNETAATAGEETGLAFDESGNLWISDKANSTLSVVTASTIASTAANTTGNSFSNTFTSITSTASGLNIANMFAIDANHQLWFANNTGTPKLSAIDITEGATPTATVPTGFPETISGSTTGNISDPTHVSIDANGNVWVASSGLGNTGGSYTTGHNSLAEFSPSGALLSPGTGYVQSSTWTGPRETAIDGNNRVWVTVCGYGNAPCNAATPGTPSTVLGGFITSLSGSSTSSSYSFSSPIGTTVFTGPAAIAIDNAGSIWVVNSGATATQTGATAIPGFLAEVVGVAAPVAIPVVQALKNTVTGGENSVGSFGNRP